MKPITKHQQKQRNAADKKAAPLYSKRREIEKRQEQIDLHRLLREVYE